MNFFALLVVISFISCIVCDAGDIHKGGLSPSTFDEVPPATRYPQLVPSIEPGALKGKRIGFIAEDLVEDIEAMFPLSWAWAGDATVEIICVDHLVYSTLADFTRPTVNLFCDTHASDVDWHSYDIIFVPGGAGIMYIRSNPRIIEGLRSALATNKTWLAVVCAGNEIGIDLQLKETYNIDTLAGPDSSVADIEAAGYKHSPKQVLQPNGIRYIMGHDPTAHTEWIRALCDSLNVQCGEGTEDGYTMFKRLVQVRSLPHQLISSLNQISSPFMKPSPVTLQTPVYPDSILVIVSRGSQWPEVHAIIDYFETSVVTVACSWALSQTPDGKFDGRQELATHYYPSNYVTCDTTIGEVNHPSQYDIIMIPSGAWSTTVLRGDPAVERLIRGTSYVITFGEANEIALNASLNYECHGSWRAYGPVNTYMKTKKFKNGTKPTLMTQDDGHGRSTATCDFETGRTRIITVPAWVDDSNSPANAVTGYYVALGVIQDDVLPKDDSKVLFYFITAICVVNLVGLGFAIYLMACRKPSRRYTRV